MEYQLKPPGYKTINQWKKEGKEPIDDSAKELFYVASANGNVFIKNGKPLVYEYVSPDKVRDIEPTLYQDVNGIPSFVKELSFLSNDYPCSISLNLNGSSYTFSSAENAYQACKNSDYINSFLLIPPSEAKKLGRMVPTSDDWNQIKKDRMAQIVAEKFRQNPNLMEKLKKCDFPIVYRNKDDDTYWGICNGYGSNKLGNILESIKCYELGKAYQSSQERAADAGNSMQEFQKELSENNGHRKLATNDSYKVRKKYGKMLPDFFLYDSNKEIPLFTRDGVQISKKWSRVVIGDYGAFVEIDPSDICMDNVIVKPGEEYRIDDPRYSENVKNQIYISKSGDSSTLYFQQKDVTYADYRPGKWYVSPYETKEGLYLSDHEQIEVPKTIEKPISKELENALGASATKIDIPGKAIVFDTETTGFSYSDEILQISILDTKGNAVLDTYVKPQHKKEWPQAMEVHHITPDKVKDAPTAISLAPLIRDIFESVDTVVGYNVGFDVRMVKQNFGVEIPKEKIHDLLPIFKQEYPSGSHKLCDAVKTYCPEVYDEYSSDAHSSATDTYATLQVFLKQTEMEVDKMVREANMIETESETDFLYE